MKVGLSNHQPVCVSDTNNFEPVGGFSWNFVGGDAIEGDLDATFFIP
jgi:hypothetical protein